MRLISNAGNFGSIDQIFYHDLCLAVRKRHSEEYKMLIVLSESLETTLNLLINICIQNKSKIFRYKHKQCAKTELSVIQISSQNI